ncbi:MAG: protein-disulfide reductase DsbD domain-containing protein [Pyrinomonadaceae bacterium]
MRVSAPGVSIPAGGAGESTVVLSISPGYHVNANPASFPYLIATEVTHATDPDDPFTAGKADYPAAVKKKFQFADEPLAVYEGDVSITLPLHLAAAGKSDHSPTKGAKVSLPIDIRLQACNQEECFPPDTLHTTIVVEVK